MKGRLPLPVLALPLFLVALAVALLAPVRGLLAAPGFFLDTNTSDFVTGSLYGTELAPIDDGTVRLMAIGLAADWSQGTTSGLPPRQQHSSVYAAGHIYVFGGREGSTNYLNTVYSSAINPATHANGPWQVQPALPKRLGGAAAVVLFGYVYVLGGFDGGDPSAAVYRSQIGADGNLGPWTEEAANLPQPLSNARAVVANGRIYLIGGLGEIDRTNRVVYSAVDAGTGNLRGWNEAASLPAPYDRGVDGHIATVIDGSIYVGLGFSGTSARNTMIHADLNGDGSLGAWQTDRPYPFALTGASGLSYSEADCGPTLYVIGGGTSQFSGPQTYVGASALLGDGTRGPWFATSELQEPRFFGSAVASDDGWIYVVDGGDGLGSNVDSVRYAASACTGGASLTRSPVGNFTSRVFDLSAVEPLNSVQLNATMQIKLPMTMTVSYRWGNNADLSGTAWSPSVGVTAGISRTTDISLEGNSARYFQYRIDMTRGDDKFGSPLLNWVRINYGGIATATPTATEIPPATSTPTATPIGGPPTETPTPTLPVPPTLTPTPTLLPGNINLVVESVALQPYGTYRPVAGHMAQVAVQIRNSGRDSVPAGAHIEVDIYANSEVSPTLAMPSDAYGVAVDGIAPGQVATVLVPYAPPDAGDLSLYAWINRPRYIVETDYGDDLAGPLSACAASNDGQTFGDVGPASWAYTYVESLGCHSIISGYGDGTFRPGNNTTRGQFAKMITLSMNWPLYTAGGPHFRDVRTNNVFYPYVETAYNRGVISGYGCGDGCLEFRWAGNITRGQLAKIIALSKGWPLATPETPTFSDVSSNSTFYSYVETIYARGLIAGYACGDGCVQFRPAAEATRAQLAKMLYYAMAAP